MEAGKKSILIVWTGVAAAVAGIVAVGVIMKWKEQKAVHGTTTTRLRDVQDVLTDLDRKIHEIEALAHVSGVPPQPPITFSVSNGNPLRGYAT